MQPPPPKYAAAAQGDVAEWNDCRCRTVCYLQSTAPELSCGRHLSCRLMTLSMPSALSSARDSWRPYSSGRTGV